MLVLTRKDHEVLVLVLEDGREVRIEVLEGGPCRLGVDAPRTVQVRREDPAGSRAER